MIHRCSLRRLPGGHVTGFSPAAFGGCAANQAGSTKQDGSTMFPLAAALVLNDTFIELFHMMSQSILRPLFTSVLINLPPHTMLM